MFDLKKHFFSIVNPQRTTLDMHHHMRWGQGPPSGPLARAQAGRDKPSEEASLADHECRNE